MLFLCGIVVFEDSESVNYVSELIHLLVGAYVVIMVMDTKYLERR